MNVANSYDRTKLEYDNYSKLYQEISSSIYQLQQVGLSCKNPNKFISLWYWYSYSKLKLEGKDEYRRFLRELYSAIISPVQKSLRKYDESTSNLDWSSDLKARFQISESKSYHSRILEKSVNLDNNFEPPSGDTYIAEMKNLSSTLVTKFPSNLNSVTSANAVIDFVIITAIEKEKDAIIEAFEIDEDTDREFKGSRCYWRKKIILKGNRFYEIAVRDKPKNITPVIVEQL